MAFESRDASGAPHADDHELVRRYQRGDMDACRTLLERHQDRLYRLALHWLYDTSEAEDVVQEVFSRALNGLLRFRFRAQPFTWFYATCRNVCRELNRRRRTEPVLDEPVDERLAPDALAQQSDTRREVHALLGTLTQRQRDVVILRTFEELSVRDTARILGCREGTVKALLHKAMAHLRARSGV